MISKQNIANVVHNSTMTCLAKVDVYFQAKPILYVVKSGKNVYFFMKIKFHIPIHQNVHKTLNPAANTQP